MFDEIMKADCHRNSPVPKGPWFMSQKWENLLFAHLPISTKAIQPFIPNELELDTYKDVAWITIIPFEVTDLRFNKTPSLPYISNFVELNVRTYVKRKGKPGIYFFSLDASKILAVTGARLSTLPYYYANMHLRKKNSGFTFYSKRFGRSHAMLQANYEPEQQINYSKRNSLDEWLLERYYAWQTVMGIVIEIRIHHTAWQTQRVEAAIKMNHLTPLSEDELLSNEPLFHFSSEKRVLFWPLKCLK